MKKKVLFSSLLSIGCCLSLITGATFALFTSESKVNIAVTSGKVEVIATVDETSLKTYSGQWNETNNAYDSVEQADGRFVNGGSATVKNAVLTIDKMMPMDKASFAIEISNSSNVAIQYRISVAAENDTGLFSGLDFKIANSEEGLETAVPLVSLTTAWTVWEIPAQENEIRKQYLSVELPEAAGNVYQNKACNIIFTVEAVQGNAVVEDNGQTEYKVSNGTQLTAAISEAPDGGVITLLNDISLAAAETAATTAPVFVENKEITIDLNGSAIHNGSTQANAVMAGLFVAGNGGRLHLTGNGTVDARSVDASGWEIPVCAQGDGKITIDGGTFIGGATASCLYVQDQGTIEINGGYFKVDGPYNDFYYVLNLQNASTGKIVVNGGTFVNQNPAKGDDYLGGNFVSKGVVIGRADQNTDVEYTVSADNVAKALRGLKDNDTVTLASDADEYANSNYFTITKGGIVFDLNGYTFPCGLQVGAYQKAAVTIKGGTINAKQITSGDGTSESLAAEYGGIVVKGGSKAIVEDVAVNGSRYDVVVQGDLTVKSITIRGGVYGFACYGKLVVETADVVVSGHAISSAAASKEGMDVTINGGSYTTTGTEWSDCAIYWAGHGQLTVNGGEFTAEGEGAGIYVKNGNVNLKGGTFSGKDGAKIAAEAGDTTSVYCKITAGTFNGSRSAVYYKTTEGAKASCTAYELIIEGGTFTGGEMKFKDGIAAGALNFEPTVTIAQSLRS